MKNLRLVLALCGAAALIGAPVTASAFETQGAGDQIDGASLARRPAIYAAGLQDPFSGPAIVREVRRRRRALRVELRELHSDPRTRH